MSSLTEVETSTSAPGRRERFGAFPASGAIVALFGGNLLVAGTLQGRQPVTIAVELVLLGVFVAYCFARPRGGGKLAAVVVGGTLLVGALVVVAPILGVVAALAVLAASFIVASGLDEHGDQLARRRQRGR